MTRTSEVVIGLFVLIVIMSNLLDRWVAVKTTRTELRQKWLDAREERERWERDHLYGPIMFYNEEYQDLWDSEIGAGDMYLQMTERVDILITSRHEYHMKERETQYQ